MAPSPADIILPEGDPDPDRCRFAVSAFQRIVDERRIATVPHADWRDFLRRSSRPEFLQCLNRQERWIWAERLSRVLAHLEYTLGDLFMDRVGECPEALYLEAEADGRQLTFAECAIRIRRIAASLHFISPEPRVLLFTSNSIEAALCDLACLCHGILVTPLSIHTDEHEIARIIDRLGITIAITDTGERVRTLLAAITLARAKPRVIVTSADDTVPAGRILVFDEVIARHGHGVLPPRSGNPFATATVMFTSGTTGAPRGLCFSQHAMVLKRFARAAALPAVGVDETLLAWLPLFHTFGRFLELQGMLFWRGRYVVAGDTSREAFLGGMRSVQPTGLIGVPLRWMQLRDAAVKRMHGLAGVEAGNAIREVTGSRLRWGLSAAGRLDPAVFRFFQNSGIEVCSGFGMTEATGGILMTPSDEYEDGSVGIPLPAIEVELREQGEMFIRGPYVASELLTEGPLPRTELDTLPWYATGDIFRELPSGHYEIIDRVKDIYKNSKGQTISPLAIEQHFRDVPAIERVFLAGDGREYNVLLIVPDRRHELFTAMHGEDERDSYLREIIRSANGNLAPFERIVRYAILDRDFNEISGELTPKGSLNRSAIARNFATTIASLYKDRALEFRINGLQLQVPNWLLRELGATEHDLAVDGNWLLNRGAGTQLWFHPGDRDDWWIVGDLEYCCPNGVMDLGTLCRHPLGWVANPALFSMFPCREGWEVKLEHGFMVRLPTALHRKPSNTRPPSTGGRISARLLHIHGLLSLLLHGDVADARQITDDIAGALDHGGRNIGSVIRSRLGCMAWHGDESLRCEAYATLLLYDPVPEDGAPYREFVNSGASFLSAASIHGITERDIRHGRLTALRIRLGRYREEEAFSDSAKRELVRSILDLLVTLARNDPSCVYEVRAELCSWMLHETREGMNYTTAETLFYALKDAYVERYATWLQVDGGAECLNAALRFDDGVPEAVRGRILSLFLETPFIPLSLLMIYEISSFSCSRLAGGIVWVSMLSGTGAASAVLVSINTRDNRHYEMQVLLDQDFLKAGAIGTMYTFMSLSGSASGPRVLPRFGSFMPDAGAVSLQHIRGLSLLDEMRRHSMREIQPSLIGQRVRRMFLRGMAAFISAWRQSGSVIIPGSANPANVSVPDDCVRGGAMILTVDGWTSCDDPPVLVDALSRHFFSMIAAHFPEFATVLDPVWICEAAREALGDEASMAFVEACLADTSCDSVIFKESARAWLHAMRTTWLPPLAVEAAVACYNDWVNTHPTASLALCERYVHDLARLFDIRGLGDRARYVLYRETVFATSREETRAALDKLLEEMYRSPSIPAGRLFSMSVLQESLEHQDERDALLRMVAPTADVHSFALRALSGTAVLQRIIQGRDGGTYMLRDALSAAEIGRLYDLFLREQFPVLIRDGMLYLIVLDEWHRIAGGAGYAFEEDATLSVELLIVEPSMRGKGLGLSLIEELSRRAGETGARQIRAPYYLRRFCLHNGFMDDPDNADLRRDISGASIDDSLPEL